MCRHRGVCHPAYRHKLTLVQDSLDTPVQRPMLRWRKRRNQYCLSITCHHPCTSRRPHHTWHQEYNTIVCRIRDRGSWASDLLMARNCIEVSEVGFTVGQEICKADHVRGASKWFPVE